MEYLKKEDRHKYNSKSCIYLGSHCIYSTNIHHDCYYSVKYEGDLMGTITIAEGVQKLLFPTPQAMS